MPKSSMASRTPSAAQLPSRCDRRVGVVHQHRLGDLEDQAAAGSADCQAATTSPMSRRVVSWRPERLTVIVSGLGRPRRQRRPAGRPRASTQRPIARISPVSSASGMKSTGGTCPGRDAASGRAPRRRRRRPVELDDRLVVQDELWRSMARRGPTRARGLSSAVCMAGPKTSQRPFPLLLAWYMASRRRAAARRVVSSSPVLTAMPTLAVKAEYLPGRRATNGRAAPSAIRSAARGRLDSGGWAMSSSRTANSSPL